VLNNRDVLGTRLRLEHTFDALDLSVYANALWRFNDLGKPNQIEQQHAYGGFEWFFQSGQSRLVGEGGYRRELHEGDVIKTMGHVQADYLQALPWSRWSLHVMSYSEFRTLAQRPFVRGSSMLGVDRAGWGEINLEVGYDTQDPGADIRKLFIAGLASVNLVEYLQVRVTVGSQRGGIKCVAGVCRDFPEFAGARAEVIARF
jgi:hypothetical protein